MKKTDKTIGVVESFYMTCLGKLEAKNGFPCIDDNGISVAPQIRKQLDKFYEYQSKKWLELEVILAGHHIEAQTLVSEVRQRSDELMSLIHEQAQLDKIKAKRYRLIKLEKRLSLVEAEIKQSECETRSRIEIAKYRTLARIDSYWIGASKVIETLPPEPNICLSQTPELFYLQQHKTTDNHLNDLNYTIQGGVK